MVNEPIELSKSININAETASFSISYLNHKNLDKSNGYTFQETETLTKDGDFYNICYNGSIRDFKRKRSDFDGVSLFSPKEAAISPPSGYKLISKSVSVNKIGKEVSYQICYSSDPSILTSGSFRKINVSIEDSVAQRGHQEYQIPNSTVMVHDSGITDFSSRKVVIDTILARNGSIFSTFPNINTLASELEDLLATNAGKVFIDLNLASRDPRLNMSYFSGHRASLSSSRQFNVSADYNYLSRKNNLDDKVI